MFQISLCIVKKDLIKMARSAKVLEYSKKGFNKMARSAKVLEYSYKELYKKIK